MGLMTDREKNDVDGMLRTLNEKRVELFGESCEKKLMDILDKDEKYLRELCKIWVSFSTDRQPLAVFAEFLSAVVRKRKTLVDFCTKEICAPFTSDSFILAVSLFPVLRSNLTSNVLQKVYRQVLHWSVISEIIFATTLHRIRSFPMRP